MRFDLVIPTLDRKEKLIACLNSIIISKQNLDIHTYIYFSNKDELENFSKLYNTTSWITCKYTDYTKCSIFWNNHIKTMDAKAIVYLNDDILLYNDTLSKLITTYLKHFPDFDGVMGINQCNLPTEKTIQSAFGVIGSEYANRFPDRQVFCPEYYRFYGDYEIYLYAKSINKFYYAEDVKIEHLHGDYVKSRDKTHRIVRKFKEKDCPIFNVRQNKKYLWGHDFNIVGEKI